MKMTNEQDVKWKMVNVDNNIYNDFVSTCKKQGRNVGDVLNELMSKHTKEFETQNQKN